ELHRRQRLGLDLARGGDRAHRSRIQLPRRRAARHPRPAPRWRCRQPRGCPGPRPGIDRLVLDLVVRDALVVDGTGAAPFRGDVLVEGRRVAAVGAIAGAGAGGVIEAAGRVVCPGFVDPHSHSDFTLLTNPTAQLTIRQGVTTEVVGNCGWTYAPVSEV